MDNVSILSQLLYKALDIQYKGLEVLEQNLINIQSVLALNEKTIDGLILIREGEESDFDEDFIPSLDQDE